jgi:predicted GIY-YIG superfamily endonuclease
MAAHQQGVAAKYTRSRRPVSLMATSNKMSRSEALRLEMKIKRQPKERKIAELKKRTTKKFSLHTLHTGNNHSHSRTVIKSVSALWRVPLKKVYWKSPVQGSPERSVFRVVVEDANGKLLVLEEISEKFIDNKRRVAAILDFLTQKKLARIQAYLAAENGEHILRHGNHFWQMTPFVQGTDLNREQYMYEKWRGSALADFLIALRRKAKNMPSGKAGAIFSLKAYIYKLIREINLYNRDIKDEIQDISCFLEKDFMPAYEKLPVAFCHGVVTVKFFGIWRCLVRVAEVSAIKNHTRRARIY